MAELQSVRPVRHPVWPVALIVFGLSVSAAWMGLLGFGLFKLIEHAI